MIEITDAEFIKIRDYIKSNYGISLSDEKKTLVSSRLRTTLTDLGFDSFSKYFEYLMKDKSGNSVITFVDKITTNHTFFMRETDHFDYYRDIVLPDILHLWGDQKDLRLWCAASSSGEEPVTLQIISQEFFKNQSGNWNTEILATDLSTQILDRAVAGIYATESLVDLPQQWQKEYFKRVDNDFSKVSDGIRSKITYRRLNLMDSFSFKKRLQVIFCRNVMIYFDSQTRDAVVRKFYEIIEPGGYLFIGHSESISNTGSGFEYIKPAVYRKPLR